MGHRIHKTQLLSQSLLLGDTNTNVTQEEFSERSLRCGVSLKENVDRRTFLSPSCFTPANQANSKPLPSQELITNQSAFYQHTCDVLPLASFSGCWLSVTIVILILS